jgi:methylase of polypeptide subunit release factors
MRKKNEKIFKENLTSKLLQLESLKILKNKKNKKICEIGCGNGNISNFLIKKIKYDNFFYLSDISQKAIQIAKKKIKNDKVFFKHGDLFKPWKKEKFDIIISDVSSINQIVADKSPWYKDIVSNSGKDGLKNVKKIIKCLKNNLKPNGILILPLISLSNVTLLKKILNTKFKFVNESKKSYWPLPNFFKKNIKIFKMMKKQKVITYLKKYNIYIAYTSVAICKYLR